MAKNPVSHVRTKDIDIRYHYVREAVQDGVINLHYCFTEEMIADMLTQNHSPVDNLTLPSVNGTGITAYSSSTF